MSNKRIYIVSGVGYSLVFNTIKERNFFNKTVNDLYNQMSVDKYRYPNSQALHTAISISVAKSLGMEVGK